jgi:hypothetical protein
MWVMKIPRGELREGKLTKSEVEGDQAGLALLGDAGGEGFEGPVSHFLHRGILHARIRFLHGPHIFHSSVRGYPRLKPDLRVV